MSRKSPLEWMVVPLRKYADFSGRASRPEYWWFLVPTLLAGVMGGLPMLALVVPGLAVTVRRLHDVGRSGWWALLPWALGVPFWIVVVVGVMTLSGDVARPWLSGGLGMALLYGGAALVAACSLLLLYWLTRPGTPGPNIHGPDPAEADQPFLYS